MCNNYEDKPPYKNLRKNRELRSLLIPKTKREKIFIEKFSEFLFIIFIIGTVWYMVTD